MQYFEEDVIEKTLLKDVPAYIEYLTTRIGDIADGQKAWIKDKVIYDDPVHPISGDIRSMTCFTDRAKVVKIISTNPIREKHYSVSVGATLLLDYEENFPVAVFDATMMSAIRTAAMAIISAQLAKADLNDVLIVGWGRVGQYVGKLIHELGYEYQVHDPFCRIADLVFDARIQLKPVFDNATVITTTNSRIAFITPENCQAEFIVSVGADTHFNFELSPQLVELRGNCYVDCWDAMRVGDLSRIEYEPDGDIFQLYRGEGYCRTFISVGSPLMDALTIEYLSNELL